jgi:Ca2+-binding RTX toxin-like protein
VIAQAGINGTAGDDTLTGTSSNDIINAFAGNDILNGGAGVDTLVGGTGNDTYVVDTTTDFITENANEGTDTIQSSVTIAALAANVENLTLSGATAINGAGNALDNILTGNSARNMLTGGAGNDTLNGSAGIDTLVGGTGNDIYVVDSVTDTLTELANEGSDTVQSSATFSLISRPNIENLVLTGAAATSGVGNAAANLLVGNSGANALFGGGGNDILQGLGGNDALSATGKIVLDGGVGNDAMAAGSGNDLLIGGKGNDAIATGSGADIIAFNFGDGEDRVGSSTGTDNILSLGGAVTYGGLSFNKSVNDLVLNVSGTDKITFAGWYSAAANHSVSKLQVIAEAMAGFNPGGGDTLLDNKVEQFDFSALATAFDAAGRVNGWALTNALLSAHLSGSDTAALGGDLAYQYGKAGSLAGIGLTPAQDVVNAPQFGSSSQTLRTLAELQQGQIRLS